jgi:hypothetical protein
LRQCGKPFVNTGSTLLAFHGGTIGRDDPLRLENGKRNRGFCLSANILMQIGLVVCTGLGFLLTSLKQPHYGVIANLIGQVFWVYSSYRAWREADQIGIFISTVVITLILIRRDELLALWRDVPSLVSECQQRDEARRIAANIAKLPELLPRKRLPTQSGRLSSSGNRKESYQLCGGEMDIWHC